MNDKRRLYIVDTTLRDGEQRAGLAFDREQKVACALMMDEAGIDQIEAGIPAMCEEEREAIREILRRRRSARIATWNRMNEEDIRFSVVLKPDILHIGIPVSDIQIGEKLKKSRDYVRERMKRCITLAQTDSCEVTLGFEDASRADISFLTELAECAKGLGIKRIRYADTVGIATPSKIAVDIEELSKTGLSIECHAHDDLGMAVANSLQAAKSGAEYINTTFFGIGERAGNCNFSKFIGCAGSGFTFGFSAEPGNLRELEAEVLSILRLKKVVGSR